MHTKKITITIVTYSGYMASAVEGLKEFFGLANYVCEKNAIRHSFAVELVDVDNLKLTPSKAQQLIIIPPNSDGVEDKYYLNPDNILIEWLQKQHALGSIICSICVGVFIVAATGLLNNRVVTTHWELSTIFSNHFPEVKLSTDKILINDGDFISVGGIMAWIDLGLEIVAQFSSVYVMRELGKILVIDTRQREQNYYQSFSPKLDHGDAEILKVQHYIQANFHKPIIISTLSGLCHIGERTFLRRFVKATGFKPTQYLQMYRIQKACEFIESTTDTIEVISLKVGYENTNAFRKCFIKIVGLTPKDFKNQFAKLPL